MLFQLRWLALWTLITVDVGRGYEWFIHVQKDLGDWNTSKAQVDINTPTEVLDTSVLNKDSATATNHTTFSEAVTEPASDGERYNQELIKVIEKHDNLPGLERISDLNDYVLYSYKGVFNDSSDSNIGNTEALAKEDTEILTDKEGRTSFEVVTKSPENTVKRENGNGLSKALAKELTVKDEELLEDEKEPKASEHPGALATEATEKEEYKELSEILY